MRGVCGICLDEESGCMTWFHVSKQTPFYSAPRFNFIASGRIFCGVIFTFHPVKTCTIIHLCYIPVCTLSENATQTM